MKKLLLLAITLFLFPSIATAYEYIHPCGPSWSNVPVSYYINDNGSGDIPDNTLNSVIADSFQSWGDPCCSSFDAVYQGRTALTAINNNGRIVLSWEENSWNPQFGSVNVTIGVTLTQIFNNCTFAEAPILFNGVGFRFSTNGSATDIQSIATHEIGHLLGLDHSPFQQATMFASYIGGTGARSLFDDDIDGVCSIYQASCSCSNSSQCGNNQVCINNLCVTEPCDNVNNPCDAGLQCVNGTCVEPTCQNDDECDPGFECLNQKCRSECAACRKCEDDGDCGTNGYCVPDGVGGNACILLCENTPCPGDADCYTVQTQQGPLDVCGSPSAAQELCPQDYICYLDGTPPDECQQNEDCPNGEICLSSGGIRVCREGADPCDSIMCDSDETCIDGVCVTEGSNNANNANNANNVNNTGGNNGGNNNTDGNSIIIINEDNGGTSESCSTTRDTPPASWWLMLVGLWFVRRRRR